MTKGGLQEPYLMVAQHVVGSAPLDQACDPLEQAQVLGSPIHQVPHQPQFMAVSEPTANPAEQLFELDCAALHVADEHGLHGRSLAIPPLR